MMMSVAEVVVCPEFAQIIDVVRSTGSGWGNDGRPVKSLHSTIQVEGVVQAATEREVKQLAMGELTEEVIKFLTQTEILSSKNDSCADRLIWRGDRYKVVKVKDNKDYGYYRAFGVYEGQHNG